MKNISQRARSVEFALKSHTEVYSESEMPLHERWEKILVSHPQLARRSLTENLTDIYTKAYEKGAGDFLITALDLSCMQAHNWNWLRLNHLIPNHVYYTEIANCNLWQRRLYERVFATKGPVRKGSRIHRPKNPGAPGHRNVH